MLENPSTARLRHVDGSRLFLAEVFRPAAANPAPPRLQPDDVSVLCAIDIESDELTLYVIAAPDADGAERVLSARGVGALRVTAIDMQLGTRTAAPCQGSPRRRSV